MDSFFGIGIGELVFIIIISLVVLGPKRLPEVLRQVARTWGYMRNLANELSSQFSDEMKALEELNPKKLLNELAEDPHDEARNAKRTAAKTKVVKPASTGAATASQENQPATPATTSSEVKTAVVKPTTSTAKAKSGAITTSSTDPSAYEVGAQRQLE